MHKINRCIGPLINTDWTPNVADKCKKFIERRRYAVEANAGINQRTRARHGHVQFGGYSYTGDGPVMAREHLDGPGIRGLSGSAGRSRSATSARFGPRPGRRRRVDVPDDGGRVAGAAHDVVPAVVQAQTRDDVHVPDDLANRFDFGYAVDLGKKKKQC